MVYGVKVSHVTLLLVQTTILFSNCQIFALVIDLLRVHTVVLKKKKKKKSLPGLQPDKQLGWKNAVIDLSSILFIKSELHSRRFAPLFNSEILSILLYTFLKEQTFQEQLD